MLEDGVAPCPRRTLVRFLSPCSTFSGTVPDAVARIGRDLLARGSDFC